MRIARSRETDSRRRQRATLLPLRYYPVDPALQRAGRAAAVERSAGLRHADVHRYAPRMQRVGVLEFTLQGQPMTLAAFVEEGRSRIDVALRARSPI